MEILVNQVGFDLGAPKFVVVQSHEDLGGEPGRVQVVDRHGVLRHETDLEYEGPIKHWGRYYWRGDFSSFDEVGEYELRLRMGLQQVRQDVVIGRQHVAGATMAMAAAFYYYQRCGTEVPGWHGPCHLDDARLPDGSRLDATGGWHDAGDYNKYNGYTPLSVFALARAARCPLLRSWPLAGGEPPAGGAPPVEIPAPEEEGAWGGAWMAKMQDPVTGFLRGDVFSGYQYWGPPEGETDNEPGTDDDRPLRDEPSPVHQPGVAMLAFATLATVRVKKAPWVECAQRLARATQWTDLPITQQAAAMLAHLELPSAAGSGPETAWQLARTVLAGQREDGSFHDPHVVDEGLVPAALAEIALHAALGGDGPPADGAGAPGDSTRRDRLLAEIEAALLRYLEYAEARSRNPFRLLQWDPDNFFHPYPEPKAWYVGQNSAYLSHAWALLTTARFLTMQDSLSARRGGARALALGRAQLDWVLGCNPLGVCMLEGAGQFNPPHWHHRYDTIPGNQRGAVPGAICNGYVRESVERDAPRFDLHGNDYHSNEPWLPHNAYYLLAMCET